MVEIIEWILLVSKLSEQCLSMMAPVNGNIPDPITYCLLKNQELCAARATSTVLELVESRHHTSLHLACNVEIISQYITRQYKIKPKFNRL